MAPPHIPHLRHKDLLPLPQSTLIAQLPTLHGAEQRGKRVASLLDLALWFPATLEFMMVTTNWGYALGLPMEVLRRGDGLSGAEEGRGAVRG